jgi:hypothetical protein
MNSFILQLMVVGSLTMHSYEQYRSRLLIDLYDCLAIYEMQMQEYCLEAGYLASYLASYLLAYTSEWCPAHHATVIINAPQRSQYGT